MFTGIVEAKQPVVSVQDGPEQRKLVVDLGDLAVGVALGASIAVNGCCLTVEQLDGHRASFHAGRETLGLTNLGGLGAGQSVNLERSLRMGDELGGHLVSGHIDGTGRVVARDDEPGQTVMTFELAAPLFAQTLLKGSIAIDGVSLTITRRQAGQVSVALIPHTLAVTTLGDRKAGDLVNVETDQIGKWILQRMGPALDELRNGRQQSS